MIRGFYTTLLTLATPLALARLGWKGRSNPAYRERILERFGFIPPFPKPPRLWVHAVSVGEVIAAAPLIRAWQHRHPDWAILLTTTTPTGSAQVHRLFGEGVEHVYLPYDLPGAVRRFFDRTRPSLGVIMETELWPNLAAEGARQGIPLVLANARLSERSMRGYVKLKPLVRDTLACFALIAARGPEDAARFIALGAPPARVEALGNLKFDLELAPEVVLRGQQWRAVLGTGRPVWIAASTHPGEERQLLKAHQKVLAVHPDALLLLAPRHPERTSELVQMIEAMGLRYVLRSRFLPLTQPFSCEGARVNLWPNPAERNQASQIMLIDTLGELMDFYAASDLAFVGGSLVPHGGHNPLEPISLKRPILTGPHIDNFSEIYEGLLDQHAVLIVDTPDSLAKHVNDFLNDGARRHTIGNLGYAWSKQHRGTVGHLLDRLEKLVCVSKAQI